MDFMTELATNATARGVDIVLYSGNDDSLIAHRSTESSFLYCILHESKTDLFIFYSCNPSMLIVFYVPSHTHRGLQNTTFGGIQGFTVKPSTPWFSEGKFAGIIRQERGWAYVLFDHASHMVPTSQPAAVRFSTAYHSSLCLNNAPGLYIHARICARQQQARPGYQSIREDTHHWRGRCYFIRGRTAWS